MESLSLVKVGGGGILSLSLVNDGGILECGTFSSVSASGSSGRLTVLLLVDATVPGEDPRFLFELRVSIVN